MSCSFCRICHRIFDFFFNTKNTSNNITVCETFSCNCNNCNKTRKKSELDTMAQAEIDMQVQSGEHSTTNTEICHEELILPPKTKKPRKQRVAKPACTTLPLIVEVRKAFTKPYPSPQVILERGWTLFFGDESGNPNGSGYLNIRNSDIGVCIPDDLFDCLVQGLNELKKKNK